METKRLGHTSVSLSAIGLGGMPLSLSGRPTESDAIAVIHKALDLGVTLIDTADSYCQDETDKHHNERLIRKALQLYPGKIGQVVVATKGGLMRPNGTWTRNGDPSHLKQTIRDSFEALGGKPIVLWQYHSPDPNFSIAESLTAVRQAVEVGQIRHVGVSNFSVAQIQEAQEIVEIVSVQNQYNPWNRQPEQDGVLDYCEQAGLTFFPWSPLGGSRRIKDLPTLKPIAQLAESKGTSVYCLVLAWLRAKSPCIVPIPGASKVASITDSVKAADLQLSAAEVEQIDQATASE